MRHIHAYACICSHMHAYECICMHMLACICMHMHAYASVCMHMHAHACLCMLMHVYDAYVCIRMHLHAHARSQPPPQGRYSMGGSGGPGSYVLGSCIYIYIYKYSHSIIQTVLKVIWHTTRRHGLVTSKVRHPLSMWGVHHSFIAFFTYSRY